MLDPAEFEASGLESGETLRAAVGDPPRAGRGGELAAGLVDDAVNRARVRTAVGSFSDGGRLRDEVIDELLAGASTEEEIVGAGDCSPS